MSPNQSQILVSEKGGLAFPLSVGGVGDLAPTLNNPICMSTVNSPNNVHTSAH